MRNIVVTLIACSLMYSLLLPQAESADRAKVASSNTATARDVMRQGKAVYGQWCLGCHAPMGGISGAFGFPPAGSYRLQQRYKDAVPAALEERVDLTPELIRTAVRQGMPIMPPLRKTEVTDEELDAVIAYLSQRKRK